MTYDKGLVAHIRAQIMTNILPPFNNIIIWKNLMLILHDTLSDSIVILITYYRT